MRVARAQQSDFFRERGIEELPALGQLLQGGLQLLPVFSRQTSRWGQRRIGGVGFALLSLVRLVLVIGRGFRWLRGRLRRARLPDALHEAHALLAQQTLHAADGVALAIKQMANSAQQVDVVGTVVTPPAAALHRPDLAETALPEPQHVLRDVELLRHFADGPECVRCFLHRRAAPPVGLLLLSAGIGIDALLENRRGFEQDRKSTRLNYSHLGISYD